MSKHSKANDDATTSSKGGKPGAASGVSALKAGSPTGKAVRSAAPKEEASWTEVANFVVTFERRESETGTGIERRITAHKMQDDGITAKWTGLAQQPMCEWMTEHVGDWAKTQPTTPVEAEPLQSGSDAAAPPDKPTALQLEISMLRAVHTYAEHACTGTIAPAELGRGGVGSLKSGTAFDVEVTVKINGLCKGKAPQNSVPCSVQFFCRNTLTSEGTRLGAVSVVEMVDNKSAYRAVLPRVSLAAGTYRLESVATLKDAHPSFAYGQSSLLEVV
jgi:hypothetical protein